MEFLEFDFIEVALPEEVMGVDVAEAFIEVPPGRKENRHTVFRISLLRCSHPSRR